MAISKFELENFGQMAAQAYLQDGVDMNDTITKLAKENSLTPDQVSRVSENANIFANGALVKKAIDTNQDPRVSFTLANAAEVNKRISSPDPGADDLRKVSELRDLYTIKKQGHWNLDEVLGHKSRDPYTSRSLDPMALTQEFVRDPGTKTAADTQTLSRVCQTLDTLYHRALTDHNLAKEAMDMTEASLSEEIRDQINAGLAPATVRDVVKAANLDEVTTRYLDTLVTKVASDLKAREGKSAFAPGSLVNAQHPLIEKAASVAKSVSFAVRTRGGLEKIASAQTGATKSYLTAVKEAR